MMKTTKKEFKNQVQEHILNSLDEQETTNPKEQLQNVVSEFKNWYSPYEQKMHPNRQEAFTDWMNGLPSCLNTEFTNYGINQTLKSWYENCGETYKEHDSDKESQLYRNLVYREFNTLLKKNDLTLF